VAKNKAFIEQMKRLHTATHNITPEVYAGIALALHRKHGWGYKRINDLFMMSEELWRECNEKGINMRLMCEEETGIELRGR
jgi:hypothetical protein